MSALKTWETGVMFWAGEPPAQTLETLVSMGFRGGQIGIPGKLQLDARLIQDWKKALEQAQFTVYTVFAAFEGESYADIPTVQRTVGFIPEVTREVRERRMMEVSDFAAQLGVAGIATHVGFVPEDTSHPDYLAVREMVRRVCDHASEETAARRKRDAPPRATRQVGQAAAGRRSIPGRAVPPR